jgi:homoserine kinase type II
MSVYTTLNAAEIQAFLDGYALPRLGGFSPIKGGIENSNYFLQLVDERELVLTLFEEMPAAEAGRLGPLLSHLETCGVPVATPLRNDAGLYLGLLAHKPAQLAPRLPGTHPEEPGLGQCRAMGEALAHLHLALQGFSLQRDNAHGASWWNALALHWLSRLPAEEQELLEGILRRYEETCAAQPDLPSGLIHGDLFRDNTLFIDDTVTGVLDFSEIGHDHWLLDIAITCNDFCRQWPAAVPDAERRTAFLAGYENARPLQDAERKALPIFLAVGALRFWLSRLDIGERNRRENRGGEHVLEKDPAEMRLLAQKLFEEAERV